MSSPTAFLPSPLKPAFVFADRAQRNINRRLSRAWVKLKARRSSHAMSRYGTGYGGWYIPDDMPQGALCYCIGVGRDASFDVALAARGAEVHSFDPTPMSVAYMADHAHKGVAFHPWGLCNADKTMRFHVPLGENHSSHFITDLHHTGKYHEVPCLRLSTIMERLGHQGREIYLLKMDIEGAWYEAAMDFIPSGLLPKVLAIEFDSPAPVWRVAPVVRMLEERGYSLVIQEKDNVTFLRKV